MVGVSMKLKDVNSGKIDVRELIKLYEDLWFNLSAEATMSLKTYNYYHKKQKERSINKFIDEFFRLIEAYPKEDNLKKPWEDNINGFFDSLIKDEPSLKLGVIDEEMKEAFIKSTKNFIKECKEFDKTLSFEDIGQALRNLWIVSILQKAFGFKIEYNKAVFGYSMLYPYTDNYLDDPEVSMKEKKEFNERFTKRLKGEKITALGEREEKIYDLVKAIEKTYVRGNYQEVYESLLIIHGAQINSLLQQEGKSIPYEKDILSISIEKGGASVLADGYLINGKLSKKEEIFSYGYGFFLQLCDDLQDVKNDKENGHMTLMSQLAGSYNLDKLIKKSINLLEHILGEKEVFNCSNGKEVKELIQENCLLMIVFAIIKNKEYFSKEYVKEANKYLPITLGYTKKINKHMKKKFKKLQSKFTQEELEEILQRLLKDKEKGEN